jgi:hypothetical protein
MEYLVFARAIVHPRTQAVVWPRGHVIVVMPDGHPWSHEELRNKDLRIICDPQMSAEQGRQLSAPRVQHVPDLVVNGLRFPRLPKPLGGNARVLDLDAPVFDAIREFLDDDTRVRPTVLLEPPRDRSRDAIGASAYNPRHTAPLSTADILSALIEAPA